MARRTVNRKDLRAENDAAEARERESGEESGAKVKKAKKAATPRKSKAKTPKEVRLKAFWVCLINQ